MGRSTSDRPPGRRPDPPPAPPAKRPDYDGPERRGQLRQPAVGGNAARLKCGHCGRWGDVKTQCDGCGAPLDPVKLTERSNPVPPFPTFPPNRTVK